MMKPLYLNACREGYEIGQIHSTMTTGDLIAFLEDFDPDTPVYLKHDGGYTFGGIRESSFDPDEGDWD